MALIQHGLRLHFARQAFEILQAVLDLIRMISECLDQDFRIVRNVILFQERLE